MVHAMTDNYPPHMRYITLSQLRIKLGNRARSSIYLDVQAGRLPAPIKLGGRLYWCEAGVDAHLRNTSYVEV